MKWATRKNLHLDRVASAWLITRFVDSSAAMCYVDSLTDAPPDSTPFGLAGAAELGPHDGDGTTFDKILAKYSLTDTALHAVARTVRSAVAHALEHPIGPATDDEFGRLFADLAEGYFISNLEDAEMLRASVPLYDALFALYTSRTLPVRHPEAPLGQRLLDARRDFQSLLHSIEGTRWKR